jgi:hypothetical protein
LGFNGSETEPALELNRLRDSTGSGTQQIVGFNRLRELIRNRTVSWI